jgi:hypothetical protein
MRLRHLIATFIGLFFSAGLFAGPLLEAVGEQDYDGLKKSLEDYEQAGAFSRPDWDAIEDIALAFSESLVLKSPLFKLRLVQAIRDHRFLGQRSFEWAMSARRFPIVREILLEIMPTSEAFEVAFASGQYDLLEEVIDRVPNLGAPLKSEYYVMVFWKAVVAGNFEGLKVLAKLADRKKIVWPKEILHWAIRYLMREGDKEGFDSIFANFPVDKDHELNRETHLIVYASTLGTKAVNDKKKDLIPIYSHMVMRLLRSTDSLGRTREHRLPSREDLRGNIERFVNAAGSRECLNHWARHSENMARKARESDKEDKAWHSDFEALYGVSKGTISASLPPSGAQGKRLDIPLTFPVTKEVIARIRETLRPLPGDVQVQLWGRATAIVRIKNPADHAALARIRAAAEGYDLDDLSETAAFDATARSLYERFVLQSPIH